MILLFISVMSKLTANTTAFLFLFLRLLLPKWASSLPAIFFSTAMLTRSARVAPADGVTRQGSPLLTAPPLPPQPALDELDLEHELEYFSEADGRSESVIGALKALGALGSGQNDRANNKED